MNNPTVGQRVTWGSWMLALAAVAGLAACASSTPAPVLLTIPPAAGLAVASNASAPAAAVSGPTVLAVRRVAIPEYLVSRRVRFRADPSTLAEWPNTYWAERIEIGVTREFTAALRSQLPGWTLCDANCGDQTPAYALQVEMVPMDYLRGSQTLKAHARITVSTGSAAPKVLQATQASYELPSGADTAQAQAQTLAELIGRVAALAATTVNAAARQTP